MMTVTISDIFSKAVRLPVVLSLLFVVSCSSKEPVYDLGPKRSPQDNQSIIRGMKEPKAETVKPLIPGYDIPAPRSAGSDPMVLNTPLSLAPQSQQPHMMPASGAMPKPQAFAAPMMPSYAPPTPPSKPLASGRRYPARQYTAAAPTVSGPMIPMEKRMAGNSAPVYVADRPVAVNQQENPSFFGRVKNLFVKDNTPPKRVPAGQRHLEGMPAALDTYDGTKGFSVGGKTNLDEELKGFPPRSSGGQRVMEGNKALLVVPPSAPKQKQEAVFPAEEESSLERVAPAINTSVSNSYNNVEKPWQQEQDRRSTLPIAAHSPAIGSVAKVEAKPVKLQSVEQAEVLMEFDISDDGELVSIPDVAPAAGSNAPARAAAAAR